MITYGSSPLRDMLTNTSKYIDTYLKPLNFYKVGIYEWQHVTNFLHIKYVRGFGELAVLRVSHCDDSIKKKDLDLNMNKIRDMNFLNKFVKAAEDCYNFKFCESALSTCDKSYRKSLNELIEEYITERGN